MNRDIFRPTRSPARELYDAFQKEAKKRDGRSAEEWIAAEMNAVHAAAIYAAAAVGKVPPTREEVALSELGARGHIDYGAKWAYSVAELIRKAPARA